MKQQLFATLILGTLAAAVHAAEPARFANGLLVAENGMTLYTFDKDSAGKSNCKDACLKVWPALAAGEASGPFSAISREDGAKQIAMNGKPLYFYAADQKPGDVLGDGSGGVWHAVRDGAAAQAAKPAASATSSNSGYGYNY